MGEREWCRAPVQEFQVLLCGLLLGLAGFGFLNLIDDAAERTGTLAAKGIFNRLLKRTFTAVAGDHPAPCAHLKERKWPNQQPEAGCNEAGLPEPAN